MFECRNITKSYQGIPIIQDISFSLNSGEMVALLGVSGVGKTTLFNILAGVDNTDSGSIWLDGNDISSKPGSIAYMLQKDLLLPYKTVLENVMLPLLLKKTNKTEAIKQALSYFELFGLSGYEDKYPSQLSGGMRQRASLLRTYLQKSKIMLLDEPFSALDALTKIDMRTWYQEISEKLSTTTLFITHDIEEALILSDRVLILAGAPGHITDIISIPKTRPRGMLYSITKEFATLKSDILAAIGMK